MNNEEKSEPFTYICVVLAGKTIYGKQPCGLFDMYLHGTCVSLVVFFLGATFPVT